MVDLLLHALHAGSGIRFWVILVRPKRSICSVLKIYLGKAHYMWYACLLKTDRRNRDVTSEQRLRRYGVISLMPPKTLLRQARPWLGRPANLSKMSAPKYLQR